MPRISLAVALGLGVGGALVDVSSYVQLEGQISRTYGRTRQYDDIDPGGFTFVLENQDGRFTPDNAASPYATKLVEGAAVCVQIGTRLTPGRVESIEPTFPDGEAGRAQVRVTCSDMLGAISRDELANGWREALVRAADPAGYYPLDDPVDSFGAVDQSGAGRGTYRFEALVGDVLFGQDGVEHDRIRITGDGQATLYGVSLLTATVGRYFSFWIEPISTGGTFSVEVGPLSFSMTSGNFQLSSLLPDSFTASTPVVAGREYFIEIDSVALTMKIDGVLQGTLAGAGVPPTVGDTVRISWGDFTLTDLYWSDFALTDAPVRGDLLQLAAAGGGAARWLELLDAASPQLTLATLPTNLSPAALYIEPAGDAGLGILNQILKAEQGHAFSTGTGTLLAPVEQVTVRNRVRSETVSASFDVAADLKTAPAFERPIRDLVARVEVVTAFGRVTVSDPAIAARAGSASSSDTVPFVADSDARAWAQDRIIRGSNTRLQAMSIVVDAMTTQTDRSADLLALRPGDRIRLTNLPATQLGYSSWDAWVVGGREIHGLGTHTFELLIAPVLDAPHVFDTARFTSGAAVKLGRSVRTNVAPNAGFKIDAGYNQNLGPTLTTSRLLDGGLFGTDAFRVTLGAAPFATGFLGYLSGLPVAPSTAYMASIYVRSSRAVAMQANVAPFTAAEAYTGGEVYGPIVNLVANEWTRVSAPISTLADSALLQVRARLVNGGLVTGDTVDVCATLVEAGDVLGDFFYGATPNTADADYAWVGAAHQSASTEKRLTMAATATTVEAGTTGPLLTTTEEPFTILVGSEQMTVVDVTGTSSPQTVKVVRGANGTTVATHASGDLIEVTPTAVFAF